MKSKWSCLKLFDFSSGSLLVFARYIFIEALVLDFGVLTGHASFSSLDGDLLAIVLEKKNQQSEWGVEALFLPLHIPVVKRN